MNTLVNTLALAISLSLSTGAIAQDLSKGDYKAAKNKIGAEYKLGKASCAALSGNPEDICVLEAKGKEHVALADLEARYKPTSKNRYQAHVAKGEAEYAVAHERCDDLAGNAKDVCVKEAKAAATTARSDAEAQMKTRDATAVADDKANKAHNKASEQSADARKDAASAKLEADYTVAKEKCDSLAGNARDACVKQARVDFSKP